MFIKTFIRWLYSDLNSELVKAVTVGNYIKVQECLEKGANPNLLFIKSCAQGLIKVVRLMIKHGASIEVENGLPLLTATHNNKFYIVKLLLDSGAKITDSAFMVSFNLKNSHITELFLEYGCDPNLLNGEPLKRACLSQNIELIDLLIKKYKVNININNGSILSACIKHRVYSSIQHLLVRRAYINFPNVLQELAKYKDNIKFIKNLTMSYKINLNLLFIYSCCETNLALCDYLLNRGVDINIANGEPLCMSISNKNYETFFYLIRKNINVNISNGRPLKLACELGDLFFVKFLLHHNAFINISYCLHIAVKNKHTGVIDVLLLHELITVNYSTIYLACIQENVPLLKRLLQLAGDFDYTDFVSNVKNEEIKFLLLEHMYCNRTYLKNTNKICYG